MTSANNPEREPEPERDQVELEHRHRWPRVYFHNRPNATPVSHHEPDPVNDSVNQPPLAVRSSNERSSPQRFTNPFGGGDELEADESTLNPAVDGITLYQTQIPIYGSGTLCADRSSLEPNQVETLPTRDHFCWSSHQHPYEIEPPSRVYNDATFGTRRSTIGSEEAVRRDSATLGGGGSGGYARQLPPRYSTIAVNEAPQSLPMPRRSRGGFANMLELWRVYWEQAPEQSEFVIPRDALLRGDHSRPWLVRSQSSFGYDPDDPKITGMQKVSQDDPEDAESQCRQQMNLQYMTYRQRRKEAQKIRIQYNVTCKFHSTRFVCSVTVGGR